ncbi:DUF6799 domain-containing protein [Lutibacter sp.]|uniref:DUF6799 domain-containing protein n=1 Tax=Lutibacter sp. TaxID=1925666 RepID=UPI0035624C0B
MKKIVIFLTFIVFGTIGLVAQDKDQVKDQDRDRDRIMLVDGDVLQIRDRDQIRLHDKITLNDGTVVNADGTYIKDQDRLRLRDGSCLDMDGVLYSDEYKYMQKLNKENKGLSESQIQERNQNRFHIMNIDGELYQIKNQSQSRLQNQLRLNNGVVVNPDGTYQNRDRKQLRLQDGECLNMDGEKYKNTYMHRKMVAQKNMKATQTKVQKKVKSKSTTPVQKKTMKKVSGK